MRRDRNSCCRACAAVALASLFATPVIGVTTIWDGGGANTNWSTSANWNTNIVPLTTHDVEFATGFGSGTTIETAGDRTANSIIISTGTTFTLSGDTLGQDTLTLTSGNITRTVPGTAVIDVNVVLGANGIWNTSTGAIEMNGPISQVTAGRSLSKTGTGTLLARGGGNYSGGTFVNQGIFRLESAAGTGAINVASGARLELDLDSGSIANAIALNGIGPGSLGALRSLTPSTLNGAVTLQTNATINTTGLGPLILNGPISGGSLVALTKQGNGSLRLNAASAHTGSTIVDDGSITLGHAEALGTGTTTINSFGSLDVLQNLNVNRDLNLTGGDLIGGLNATWSGPITANTTLGGDEARIVSDVDLFTVAGNIDGGGFDKFGAGRVILSGSNTFTRAFVQEGALSLRSNGAAGGAVTLVSGAEVEISGSRNFPSGTLSLIGTGIANAGALRVISGVSTWGGNISLTGDTSVFVANAAQLGVSGAITGLAALHKTGPGTLVLNGAGQWNNGTFIEAGTLSISSDSNLGPGPISINGTLLFNATTATSRNVTMNGGRLQAAAGATVTIAGATLSGGFLAGPGTFNTQNSANLNGLTALAGSNIVATGTTFLNNFINGGNFTANTALTWNGGINSSSGKITLGFITLTTTAFSNDGVITLNNGGTLLNIANTLTSGGGSRITINSGGTLNVTGNSLELNGALLVNNGTVLGTTNVNFGSLAKGSGTYGAVNVSDGGKFSPGNSPGTVITGSTTWNAGGGYVVEFGDESNDFWQVNGALKLNSSAQHPFVIAFSSLDDLVFDNSHDYSWPVLHADAGIVNFDPSALALDVSEFKSTLGGGHFSLNVSSSDIIVNFSAVPEAGTLGLFAVAALGGLLRVRRKA